MITQYITPNSLASELHPQQIPRRGVGSFRLATETGREEKETKKPEAEKIPPTSTEELTTTRAGLPDAEGEQATTHFPTSCGLILHLSVREVVKESGSRLKSLDPSRPSGPQFARYHSERANRNLGQISRHSSYRCSSVAPIRQIEPFTLRFAFKAVRPPTQARYSPTPYTLSLTRPSHTPTPIHRIHKSTDTRPCLDCSDGTRQGPANSKKHELQGSFLPRKPVAKKRKRNSPHLHAVRLSNRKPTVASSSLQL